MTPVAQPSTPGLSPFFPYLCLSFPYTERPDFHHHQYVIHLVYPVTKYSTELHQNHY